MPEKKYREITHITTCHESGKVDGEKTRWALVRTYEGKGITGQALYRFEGNKPKRVGSSAFVSKDQYRDFKNKIKSHELPAGYLEQMLKNRNIPVSGLRILYFYEEGDNGHIRYGMKQSGEIVSAKIVKRIEISDKVVNEGPNFEEMFKEPITEPAEDPEMQLADVDLKHYHPGDKISPDYADGDTGKLPELSKVQNPAALSSSSTPSSVKPPTLAESARARVAKKTPTSKHAGQAKKFTPIKPSSGENTQHAADNALRKSFGGKK